MLRAWALPECGAATRAKASGRAADLTPILAEIRAAGASSLRQVADALNERGIPTARGGRWSSVQVMRAEKLAD
ncbi:MAG: recombinase family protein [Methylorubrum extorquens]|uniref:recombinase family protein n=1 Tax=Methylorubrum extorquens TaxID=408 RepID=UPI002FEE38ED